MDVDDLAHIIDIVDNNSRIVNEVTGITKSLLAKDPKALDGNLAEYLIKNHFGESTYEILHKIYHDIVGFDNGARDVDSVQGG